MKNAAQQSEFYQHIGESIRKFRNKHKLSQEALAKLVGLTRTSLTNIESGRQHPPLHTFCEIAAQLGADFSELLPRSPTPATAIDIGVLAASQARGDSELAFFETGIGIERRDPNGDTTKENPGDGRHASS
jgi:transcriptional regulator with XRE-family HTH domain